MPPPDLQNFNYNFNQRLKQPNDNLPRQKSNGTNVSRTEMSSTSLRTTTTQTKQKKRDRKKRKPNVSITSSEISDFNVLDVASSSTLPVKEERCQNIIPMAPDCVQRKDIGPAYLDVKAIETGGKYNLKIALKMKPPDNSLSTIHTLRSVTSEKTNENTFTSIVNPKSKNSY